MKKKTDRKEIWEYLYESDTIYLESYSISELSKLYSNHSEFLDATIFNEYNDPTIAIGGYNKQQMLDTFHDFAIESGDYGMHIIHGIRYETDREVVKRLEKEKKQKIANEKAKQKRKEQKEKNKIKEMEKAIKIKETEQKLMYDLADKYNMTLLPSETNPCKHEFPDTKTDK